MLLLAEVDSIPQEGGCKRNSVWPGGSTSGIMVLTLLTKIVALHVGPTAIDIRGLGLELVSRFTLGLEERLDDSIYVLLDIAVSARILEDVRTSKK